MKYLTLPLLVLTLLLCACDKGYEARISNYYFETLDSVIVGESGALFTNVAFKQTTSYLPVKQGKHSLEFITRSKKRIRGTFEVPKTGTGKYTLQLDGIQQVSILEDLSQ
jgi:hypothetical protein